MSDVGTNRLDALLTQLEGDELPARPEPRGEEHGRIAAVGADLQDARTLGQAVEELLDERPLVGTDVHQELHLARVAIHRGQHVARIARTRVLGHVGRDLAWLRLDL